jgi:hypothetical protein
VSKTLVSIKGSGFTINGQPTYAGRSYRGKCIEGLLMNSRVVQATFDDLSLLSTVRVENRQQTIIGDARQLLSGCRRRTLTTEPKEHPALYSL